MGIERLPRQGLARRGDEWFSYVRNNSEYSLPFDDWLAMVATPAPAAAAGLRLSRGKVSFELRHGKRYAIEDSARGARTFDGIIDGQIPLVAFVDDRGHRGPWITVAKLFTIEEIVGMRELPD
ncbi:hypothetical protein AU476_06350 [Cupriavidus sp. UYMSc13B]|nr:hypothetical protein AU476_06350 [Cupriavidus sp. UYMSc13B]